MNRGLRKQLLILGIGFAIAAGVCVSQGLLRSQSAADAFRHLSDGFFVAGFLLLGAGGLVWTYSNGVMDGLGFSTKTLLSLKWKTFGDYREGFAEYRKRREAKNGSPRPYLLAGGLYMAAALLLLLGYYLLPPS